MKRLLKLAGLVTAGVGTLLAVALLHTLFLPVPASLAAERAPQRLEFDEQAAVQRFAGAVRLVTVSTSEGPPTDQQLGAFHEYLAQQFPLLHAKLQREVVGHGALLFTWPGTDATIKPIILMAHQDTVPVDPQTRARWHRDPWSGEVADGVVWGRGALDDKGSLLSILEATEHLVEQGFTPKRTIYLAFGSDEEAGGKQGAEAIVALLEQRHVQAQLVLDEGGALTRDLLPGVPGDVALVGISEKGYVSVNLTVQSAGGHSSQPPPQSAIGIMSEALVRLEKQQMPARLTTITGNMLDAVASQMPFGKRLAVSNRWLFGPLLLRSLEAAPSANAMVRTTTAETTFNAGVKDNVLPTVANATVNFRILPGDSVAAVLDHVRRVVNDERVSIAPGEQRHEPSPVSPIDGEGYKALQRTIGEVIPNVRVAPYLVVAATDSSHYVPVSAEQLRFVPYRLTPQTVGRFHGIDEGMPVSDYLDCVQFVARFIRNTSS